MKQYRVTIRHGDPPRYHVEDVVAASLPEAILLVVERLPATIGATADLLEIRSTVDPEDRRFGPA